MMNYWKMYENIKEPFRWGQGHYIQGHFRQGFKEYGPMKLRIRIGQEF
jgi:hypothetical protein